MPSQPPIKGKGAALQCTLLFVAACVPTGLMCGAVFRIKNEYKHPISWKITWRYTSYTKFSEVAGISVNGKSAFASDTCGQSCMKEIDVVSGEALPILCLSCAYSLVVHACFICLCVLLSCLSLSHTHTHTTAHLMFVIVLFISFSGKCAHPCFACCCCRPPAC